MNKQSILSELKQHVIDLVECGAINEDNYEDAHYIAFNGDYYIIGYYQAEQWLLKHGLSAFEAVAIVTHYEKENFGQSWTYEDAESTVNMLAYVYGEQVIPYADTWEGFLTELDLIEAHYEVTYASDILDTNPTKVYFETEEEALEWLQEEVTKRVDAITGHGNAELSADEIRHIAENEYTLARVTHLETSIITEYMG